MSFGQKLINVMKTQNLNQKDLVLRTGISKTTISGWLHGAANPAPERQRQVAQALGLPIDYFDDNRNQLIPKMTVEEVAYIMGYRHPQLEVDLRIKYSHGAMQSKLKMELGYIGSTVTNFSK